MDEPQETTSPRRQLIELIVLVALVTAFVGVSLFVHKPYRADAHHRQVIGIILAAGLTLIMYSFLYRDNPLFKIAENLYVGVALGFGAVHYSWRQSLRPEVVDPLFRAVTREAFYDAVLHRSVPILLGLMLLTRLSRKRGWISRYAYALMVGWGAGFGIVVVTQSWILRQLHASISALQPVPGNGAAPAAFSQAWLANVALPTLGAVAMLAGTVTVLFYFFFSIKHRGLGGAVSRVGIWFLMISFGASFGYTVMGRLSLLIGRVRFLLFEWLKLPD